MKVKELQKNCKNLFKAISIMAYIDYSSDGSNSNSNSKNILEDDKYEFEISLNELRGNKIGTLTTSALKSFDKQQEQTPFPIPIITMPICPPEPPDPSDPPGPNGPPGPSCSSVILDTPRPPSSSGIDQLKETFNIQQQIAENNNMALVYGLAENLEILRSLNEEICERLDWVTQQTEQIREQFNEDHEEAKRQRKYDRILGMAFSMLETTLFIVGIIYATILFLIEMYYSVNIDFI